MAMILTCSVGQLILLALYPVLQGLSISPSDSYLLLDRFGIRVRHAVLGVSAASMAAGWCWRLSAEMWALVADGVAEAEVQ